MPDKELEERFMAELRRCGLTDEMMRAILNAPPNFKVPHHVVTDIDTHVGNLRNVMKDKAEA